MLRRHKHASALATLAVQNRPTSRYLLFDEASRLCGRRTGSNGPIEQVREASKLHARAFSGVHIISSRIFDLMHEEGAFSIIPVYLRLAASGDPVLGFPADQYYWRDLGRPEEITQATRDIQNGTYKAG
jgi:NDP-sugar pyrophosphorylase family protein